jgi:hypothetical protein
MLPQESHCWLGTWSLLLGTVLVLFVRATLVVAQQCQVSLEALGPSVAKAGLNKVAALQQKSMQGHATLGACKAVDARNAAHMFLNHLSAAIDGLKSNILQGHDAHTYSSSSNYQIKP